MALYILSNWFFQWQFVPICKFISNTWKYHLHHSHANTGDLYFLNTNVKGRGWHTCMYLVKWLEICISCHQQWSCQSKSPSLSSFSKAQILFSFPSFPMPLRNKHLLAKDNLENSISLPTRLRKGATEMLKRDSLLLNKADEPTEHNWILYVKTHNMTIIIVSCTLDYTCLTVYP